MVFPLNNRLSIEDCILPTFDQFHKSNHETNVENSKINNLYTINANINFQDSMHILLLSRFYCKVLFLFDVVNKLKIN